MNFTKDIDFKKYLQPKILIQAFIVITILAVSITAIVLSTQKDDGLSYNGKIEIGIYEDSAIEENLIAEDSEKTDAIYLDEYLNNSSQWTVEGTTSPTMGFYLTKIVWNEDTTKFLDPNPSNQYISLTSPTNTDQCGAGYCSVGASSLINTNEVERYELILMTF